MAIAAPEAFNINKWDDVTTSEVYARKSEILAHVHTDGTKSWRDIVEEVRTALGSRYRESSMWRQVLANGTESFLRMTYTDAATVIFSATNGSTTNIETTTIRADENRTYIQYSISSVDTNGFALNDVTNNTPTERDIYVYSEAI